MRGRGGPGAYEVMLARPPWRPGRESDGHAVHRMDVQGVLGSPARRLRPDDESRRRCRRAPLLVEPRSLGCVLRTPTLPRGGPPQLAARRTAFHVRTRRLVERGVAAA